MVILGSLRLAHGGERGCGSERLRYQFLQFLSRLWQQVGLSENVRYIPNEIAI